MRLRIEQDTDPHESPREWDNVGTMVCFHKRYNLGDETDLRASMFDGWDELEKYLREEEDATHILPIYLYDHSGITMNTTGFACGWDSGQVGFIYTTLRQLTHLGVEVDKAEEALRLEVQTYDQYLTGDVWGFIVEDDDGEEVDSCWGLYGRSYAEEEGDRALRDAMAAPYEDRLQEKCVERRAG